jgi:hypothetical protein
MPTATLPSSTTPTGAAVLWGMAQDLFFTLLFMFWWPT